MDVRKPVLKARRRFHGYCPSVSRRASNSFMVAPPDDYTSTLSGMTVRVINHALEEPIHEVAFAEIAKVTSFECDDESSVLEILENNEELRKALHTGIRRRAHGLPDAIRGGSTFVTSLSYDSRDESYGPASRKDLLSIKHALLAPPEEEEEDGPDCSFESDTDISSPERPELVTPESSSVVSVASLEQDNSVDEHLHQSDNGSFLAFRVNYLIVTVAIMLADGLQGTHLYVLYEGYGYSVASLYCLGFVTGAVTSPITGPLVDRMGRKKAALIYCALEIGINMLELYPNLAGLVISRMVGGITTNLLSSVFETWLDTEYRRKGFDEEKYESIMRDSIVASNLAAIGSGYLAHQLAERLGPVGPFEGAVTCTAVALAVVAAVWSENYGSAEPGVKSVVGYLSEAVHTFKSNSKVLRVGLIQGLTCGSIQIFIFLWSPALRELAKSAPKNALGLDSHGEPAYGLIFGAFMAAGVIGGLFAPFMRSAVTNLLTPLQKGHAVVVEIEGEGEVRPMAVEFLAAACYVICACLLTTPYILSGGESSFSMVLCAFLLYEFIVGIYMPCEGVIRSIYIPSNARCSLMTLPRIIVNIAVSLGVISTNFVSLKTAFAAVSTLMVISAGLQLSLVSSREWASLFGKYENLRRRVSRSLSFSSVSLTKKGDDNITKKRIYHRSKSTPLASLEWTDESENTESKKDQ